MDTRQFDRGQVAIGFPGAADANRNIAGVAAAARAARQAIDRDARSVGLVIGDGGTLDDAAWRDIERLRGDVPVLLFAPDEAPVAVVSAQVPSAREVLLATGKASDGLISRWLNRPISRAISALLLRYTGAKPVHATLGTAALALAMFAAQTLDVAPRGVVERAAIADHQPPRPGVAIDRLARGSGGRSDPGNVAIRGRRARKANRDLPPIKLSGVHIHASF